MNDRVLPEADGEAIAAATWYDEQRPGLGDEFLAELAAAFASIRQSPGLMPRLEYYTGQHPLRRQLLKRFPYAVIVLCRTDELVVVAVAHTRRRPLYWLDRLN